MGSLAPAAGPTDARPPFRFSALMRVGFDETDAQGVVYYGRYMPYFDRARVEYWRHLGLLGPRPAVHEFVMRRSLIEYEAPARFDDPLEVFLRTSRLGRSSTEHTLSVHHAESGELMALAQQVMVLIDAARRRPAPIPDAYRRAVESLEGAV
jgi:acyl-CoA thioester hydrolase